MHLRALRQMLADVTEPLQLWRSLLTQQLRIDQSLVKIAAAMELRDPEDASLAEAFRSADESTFWRVQAAPGCGKTRLLLRLTRALCLGCNFFMPTTLAGILSPALLFSPGIPSSNSQTF